VEEPDQERFIKGLDQFENHSAKIAGRAFVKLPIDRQTHLLQSIFENSNDPGMADMSYCLNTVKRYTIQGYLRSKYIMTEIMPYQLIPGSYESCKPIENSKPVNIHA
jgi:hypothetical protein